MPAVPAASATAPVAELGWWFSPWCHPAAVASAGAAQRQRQLQRCGLDRSAGACRHLSGLPRRHERRAVRLIRGPVPLALVRRERYVMGLCSDTLIHSTAVPMGCELRRLRLTNLAR